MRGHLGLTVFATLVCGASAIVTPSPGGARWLVPRRASRVVAPVAARFECDEPAKKPNTAFMLNIPYHSCIAHHCRQIVHTIDVFDLFRGDDDASQGHGTMGHTHGDLDMDKKQVWEKNIDNEEK